MKKSGMVDPAYCKRGRVEKCRKMQRLEESEREKRRRKRELRKSNGGCDNTMMTFLQAFFPSPRARVTELFPH